MLARTDAIRNEVLEPITFVLAYPTVLFISGEGGRAYIARRFPGFVRSSFSNEYNGNKIGKQQTLETRAAELRFTG
jgi:hypothetical protein